MGPLYGLSFGAANDARGYNFRTTSGAVSEARSCWQWWNYLHAQRPDGKAILRINLDETAICLFDGDAKGTVFASKRRPRGELFQRVSRGQRRTYLTHVALVCDRADIQPLLPQTIVGNERTFRARDMATLRAACPTNFRLVRQRSAWNNEVLCAAIVRLIAAALWPHKHTLQPILFLDTVRVHSTRRVLAACAAAGIWPIFVAAKMTWLLQPLDTHAFWPFKAHLRRACQAARTRSASGQLDVGDLLGCVYEATRCVIQGRRWAPSFDKNGFGSAQTGTSRRRVLASLQLDDIPSVSSARPALDDLRWCFPRRAAIQCDLLWRCFDGVVAGRGPQRDVVDSDAPLGAAPVTRAALRRGALSNAAAPGVAVAAAPLVGAGSARLHAALARGRPLPVPRGWPLAVRARGVGRGRGR